MKKMEAVEKLEEIYSSVAGYEPQQPSLFSRWLGVRPTEAPKGTWNSVALPSLRHY